MKKLAKLLNLAFLSALLVGAMPVRADDTDLFNQPPGSNPPAPNILFILDNTSNWDRASQQWVGSAKQGNAELLAIKNFVAGLTKPANVGLMEYTVTGQTGGYVRYGIRDMTNPANNMALQNIVSQISVTGSAEKVNASGGNITNALYESWNYFNGSASWAGMDGNADYSGNVGLTPAGQSLTSGFAYKGSTAGSGYNSPIGTNCAKTYIIFIGNNGPNASPAVPASTDPAITTLTKYNYSSQPDISSAWTRFLHLRPDLAAGSVAAANGSVTTYTIDAYNLQQTASYTTILKNMAREGGGQYFQAGSDAGFNAALQNILTQIQAINSVFAAAALPVSVSVRGTYLNQVYLGVFRPDKNSKPNWAGNLKQYQLGVDTTASPPILFLADSTGAAAQNPTSGFVNPFAISFWTKASTFWDPTTFYVDSQGLGGSSDSPDGDLVEKGGAAQYIRTTFATSQAARNLYTCTGTCGSGSLLSATRFNTSNTAVMSALGTTNTTEQANIVSWVRGGYAGDTDYPGATSTDVRGFAHGDVLHSRPTVINYGRNADDIVVFYGSNDGILHAVKGGQQPSNGDGNELWGFIAPEHFGKFKRLRDHSPTISSTTPKPYFIDGSPTSYTFSTANDGKIDAARGDKAYLFLTMRRGGRFIYALDVSDPSNPKFLWKHSNADAGFAELGETWSDMRVVNLRYGIDPTRPTNPPKPMLVFGMGNDASANDPTVQGTATRGRGVMVLDATTGALVWQTGPSVSGGLYNRTTSGMTYAIPASLAVYDSNSDGLIDRIYAADTGANIWRINVDDANPANWTVTKLASLGGTSINARKFLFAPDIVPATPTNNFDSLLIGSGDREHPFDTSIKNRYYMVKDSHGLNSIQSTPIVEGAAGSLTGVSGQLYDATADLVLAGTTAQQTAAKAALAAASGWYITLGTGEKVVGGSTTQAGTVFFGTNTPTAVAANACVGNLGEARIYAMNYLTGAPAIDQNYNGILTTSDRYQTRAGGGYPPTPVPISVKIGSRTYQGAISGTTVVTAPTPALGRRYRVFWRRLID